MPRKSKPQPPALVGGLPPRTPKTYKVPGATLAQMAELARRWGGATGPATATAVLVEAVRRAWAAARGDGPTPGARPSSRSGGA